MYENDQLLIICPDEQKNYILKQIDDDNKIKDIKFMNIETFIDNYYYQYDYMTVSYIMKEYQVNLDISKMYLKNMYIIDTNKKYHNPKLKFLREVKKKLIEKKLLKFNPLFKTYLKTRTVKVVNYPKLEKYLVKLFHDLSIEIVEKKPISKNFQVYEVNDIYEEIIFVIHQIINLSKKGVKLNHIFIINLQEDYDYLIRKLFNVFHIPIQMQNSSSIDSILLVKKYLVTGIIPEIDPKNKKIVSKLIDIENSLVNIKDDPNYKIFLKDRIRDTKISPTKYQEAVTVSDLFSRDYDLHDYVFLMGMNEKILPHLYQDENYLTDQDIQEIEIYSTQEKNKREKEIVLNYLSNIPNLYISYKLNSFKDRFYPSSIISDYHMKVIQYNNTQFNYSNHYNQRMLAVYLDNYYKYKEENKNLKPLYKTYQDKLLYHTYTNTFSRINQKKFLSSIGKINLSYTSMNNYNLCKFKYYIRYILKLDPFCETFQTLIGNLFHHILEIAVKKEFNFNFDLEWNNYISRQSLEIKELFFLEKLKKNLLHTINIIKEQKMYTDFKDCYCEKEITIPLNNNQIESYFTGKIDKIMYHKKYNDTYFAIVDYKTGSFETNLNNMKYGIKMQLATYLYLVEKSNLFENPILTGMYFQQVLMKNASYDGRNSYLDKMKENLKLVGYSTSDEENLSDFDHEYTDSKVIKSMKVTSKGFSRYTKLINSDLEYHLFHYTEKIIYDTLAQIISADFSIDPKKIEFKDESCKHCKYHNLCYVKEEDYCNLDHVEDLSFLEGEIYGQ